MSAVAHVLSNGSDSSLVEGADTQKNHTGQTSRVLVFRSAKQKRADGEALERACEDTGIPLAAVARAWGRSDALARAVVAGVKPLSPEKIEKLPPKVKAAFRRGVQLTLNFGGTKR